MKRQIISDALDGLDPRYVQEAEDYPLRRQKKRGFPVRAATAACIAAVLLFAALGLLSPEKGPAVYAYAAGTEEEITSAGALMSTGAILDSGERSGRPLMFFLTGRDIDTVRFSCRRQRIRFTDWTEQREEYGSASNFTVPYGDNESEYHFLMVEWDPRDTLTALAGKSVSSVAELPQDLKEDEIVLEITFQDGTTAQRAISIQLQDDGEVYAAFQDYAPDRREAFLDRPDATAVPREVLNGTVAIPVSFLDADGQPVQPTALWYNLAQVSSITVGWTGTTPDAVRAVYIPSGSETLALMAMLSVVSPGDGDSSVSFSPAKWASMDLHGELHFELTYGERTISSDTFLVHWEISTEPVPASAPLPAPTPQLKLQQRN